jgi:hypothetical protein
MEAAAGACPPSTILGDVWDMCRSSFWNWLVLADLAFYRIYYTVVAGIFVVIHDVTMATVFARIHSHSKRHTSKLRTRHEDPGKWL